MAQLPSPYQQDMTIKKTVTIADGATTSVSIPIPTGIQAALKGYGYTWFTGCTYQLRAGDVTFPTRTDQEGSASIPRLFENAVEIRGGAEAIFTITNGSGASHDFEVVFYFYVTQMFSNTSTYQSTGGELVINTASGSGSGNSVVIYDSSFTTAANVTSKGVYVDVQSPASIVSGTTTATAAGAALASSTACKKVKIKCSSPASAAVDANGFAFFIGGSAGQDFGYGPGDTAEIEVDNLADIYVKRAGASNTALAYIYTV